MEWLFKYRERLKPRIAQLGWGADIDNIKLIVLAPSMQIKNAGLDATVLEKIKRLNCEAVAAYIDPSWIKNENISINGITAF